MNIIIQLLNTPNFIYKIIALTIELMYLAFAFILYRQVKLMASTFDVPTNPLLIFLTFFHLGAIIGLFIISIILL